MSTPPPAAAPTVCITGALGYSGRAIAERLDAAGCRLRTLTASPNRPNPFGDRLDVRPFHWDDPAALAESLEGAGVLVNTYWVRFNHRLFTHEQAVRNSAALFRAAAQAGVRKIVHVSILNPSPCSRLSYYAGKARVEQHLADSGVPHAILRPGVLFGRGDILVNNIAWALRRLPVFGVFGKGDYGVRPLHVDDFAALAARLALNDDQSTIDAVGPEYFHYKDLVRAVARAIGVRRLIVGVPETVGWLTARVLSAPLNDVLLTRQEIRALTTGLLASPAPAAGPTKLTEWLKTHADTLGRRYHAELGRRTDRVSPYLQTNE